MAIQKRENDLVIATFGRSFYVLDDYSPLRTFSSSSLESNAILFEPRKALQYNQVYGGTSSDDAGGKSMIEGGRALLQQVDVQQVVASAAGCAGAVAGVAGATIETLDALNKEPEPLFTLACGHTFHEACLRGWSIVGKQNSCP